MKTIGLIGGTSWYSTIDYYRIINETVNKRIGNNSSAKILLYSVDFAEIALFTQKQDWDAVASIFIDVAKRLEYAGADCLLLCANTMHINAEKIQAQINIPLLHIADVTVKAIKEKAIRRVLLLGTKYTMLSTFYADRLEQQGIETLVPKESEMEWINNSIYNELGKGIILPETKKQYLQIINDFLSQGAEGVILGCTEIPLLIKQEDCMLPIFDTTLLHATAAVDFALN